MSHLFSHFDYKNIFLASLFLFFFYLSFRAFMQYRMEGMSNDAKNASLAALAEEYASNAYESIKTTISNESADSSKSVNDIVRKHEAEIKGIIESQSNLNNSDSIKKRVDEIIEYITRQVEETKRRVETVKGSGIIFNNAAEQQKIEGIVKNYIVPN
jgi:CRISPR/Cas system CMR subunit Cmr6 (Cas7 group RAMP superfamily)